jgi:hypothetical protein
VVVKVELPETPVLTRAEVVTAEEEAPDVADPPAPPIPKIVVEPIVDPPEVMAEVVMAEEEATVVVVAATVVVAVPAPDPDPVPDSVVAPPAPAVAEEQ